MLYRALLVVVCVAFIFGLGSILADLTTVSARPKPAPPACVCEVCKCCGCAAPKVAQGAAPAVVEGIGDGELRKRIMLRIIRGRVVDKAVKDGVPVPGGGTRKVTRAEAEKLAQRITDDDVLEYAKVKGAPVQGLGDGSLLRWLWENKEAIISFLLSILSLFAEDAP
jgi:hypothetical protein